jgi:hypothetical protein
MKLTADLFSSNAAVDSIVGGDGTDMLSVGKTGTTFAIGNADAWTRITGVESIVAVANTAAVTISLDSTAATTGIAKVDLSAVTGGTRYY